MRVLIALLLILESGCQSYAFPPLSERHPANPAALETREPALPTALRREPAAAPPPAPPTPEHRHAH